MGTVALLTALSIMNSSAATTLVLLVVGICLVTAEPEPEANPGFTSGYGGHGVSHGGFSGHHGGHAVASHGHGSYVSRPVATHRVVKVVNPVVVHRPVVSHHGGFSGGYRRPVSSGYGRW